MALMQLPNELQTAIITHVIPEGFESLAVTCKRMHTLCIPFSRHHKALKLRFRDFAFYVRRNSSNTIATSGDLIRRIAAEPVVARYIRSATLRCDGHGDHGDYIIPFRFIQESDCQEDILRLFASCPYLKRAGLDWRDYLEKIEGEISNGRYSQYAAAFLLTLLPNVETLVLPKSWRQLDDTDKLIDAICEIAKQTSSHAPYNRFSLARVTEFKSYPLVTPHYHFDLDLTKPFLVLPQVRSFYGPNCVAFNDQVENKNTMSKGLSHEFGKTLEFISFPVSCIEEKAIDNFLKDTSQLKTFVYSHSQKYYITCPRWDICKFIAAVKLRVGSQLVELSLSIQEPASWIADGNVSMREGFPCLRRLEIPLEVVTCNMTANESTVGGSSNVALSIGDLIPASVSTLSLISYGKDQSDEALKVLKVLFLDFAVKKESLLPALTDIHLVCPLGDDIVYKNYCKELRSEAHKVGVVLHVYPWWTTDELIWNDERKRLSKLEEDR